MIHDKISSGLRFGYLHSTFDFAHGKQFGNDILSMFSTSEVLDDIFFCSRRSWFPSRSPLIDRKREDGPGVFQRNNERSATGKHSTDPRDSDGSSER